MARIVLILVGVGALLGFHRPSALRAESPFTAAQIQHGQYLVLHVAMCVQCHTPRDSQGRLDDTHLLQGAPIPVSSPFPALAWAFHAPALAGLPGGWTAKDLSTFLQTGKRPDGTSPKPPMPPFRLSAEDATAVVAYLESLPP